MGDRRSHMRHDRFAVAAAVGRGAIPATVGSCPSCGSLLADLLSIRAAIRDAWVPTRPRDLLLSPSDVARSRPAAWRRLLDMVGSAGDAVTRPLAVSLTGLGIAGLLLTTLPLGGTGAPGTAVPIEMRIDGTAGRALANGEDLRTLDAVEPDPAAVISVGLLGAGGAIFGLRLLARRARGVR